MSNSIQCNLAQNALDYLILAGEQAQEGGSRMLKHSLATLADGIELLLKARLEMYDWCLLFKNVDRADKDEYINGDFQSVTVEQSVNRLEKICGVYIDEKHLQILNTLRKHRKKIRHFAFNSNKEEAISLITKTYSFAIDFTTEQLESHHGKTLEQELKDLRKLLGNFEVFVKSRLEVIQPILKSQDYTLHVECPKCHQKTLYPDGGRAKCTFCGYDRKGDEAAIELIDHIHKLFRLKEQLFRHEYIDDCPECGSSACIYNDENERYICLSCGECGNYNRCTDCDCLFTEEPAPNGACAWCWQDLLRRND